MKPRLTLIKGGKKPPKPPSQFLKRLKDFYWEPWIASTLVVMMVLLALALLISLTEKEEKNESVIQHGYQSVPSPRR